MQTKIILGARMLLKLLGVVISVSLSCSVLADSLKILTINAAFVTLVSKKYKKRLVTFANDVSRLQADLITLQEVSTARTRKKLIQDFKLHGYPYAQFARGQKDKMKGIFSSGLLIVSRYPF